MAKNTAPDNLDYSTTLTNIEKFCIELRASHAMLNKDQKEYEDMYLMNDPRTTNQLSRIKGADKVKVTLSPDARNKVQGAVRLMVASDPTWSVPKDKNSLAADPLASKVEHTSGVLWNQASRLFGAPLHYEMITSGFLFSDMVAEISLTKDIVEAAKGASRATQLRAEQAAELSPFKVDIKTPRTVYYLRDGLGLSHYHRQADVMVGELLDTYGDQAKLALGKDAGNRLLKKQLNVYYDLVDVCVWVTGSKVPLVHKQHGLPFIPVVANFAEGSTLFEKPEDQRQPFMYALMKSGLWRRQNLTLSVMYQLIFAIGANPMFKFKRNREDKQLAVNFDRVGGYVALDTGEEYEQVAKNAIDPSLIQGLQIAEQKIDESTIYDQALGEPLASSAATFSLTSLLNQVGRLPLIMPQRKISWLMGDAMRMMLRWASEEGMDLSGDYGGNKIDLSPEELRAATKLEIQANLEINLPQDKQMAALVATQLTAGDNPLTTHEYARSTYLGIGQPDEMQEQIWTERTSNMMYAQFVEQLLTRGAPAPQGVGAPGAQQMPPNQPQGGPMPAPQQQGAMSAEEALATLPPQIVQGLASGQIPQEMATQLQQVLGPEVFAQLVALARQQAGGGAAPTAPPVPPAEPGVVA